jgi:hypothetical protein
MITEQLLPCSVSYLARQFSQISPAKHTFSPARVRLLPKGEPFLAFDFTYQKHASVGIEGIDRYYSNSTKSMINAHQFASSAFISAYQNHDPLPFQLQLSISKNLECSESNTEKKPKNGIYYPYQTAVEQVVAHFRAAREVGVGCMGVVVDAEFTSKDNLNFLHKEQVSVIGRMRKSIIVEYEGKSMAISKLATLFPRMHCSNYSNIEWRAKGILVKIPELDQSEVKIIIVWRKVGLEWISFFLICTNTELSVGQAIRLWKKRWQIEVLHRLYKQNFGLPYCQFKSYGGQQNHANMVVEAYWLAREERGKGKGISWKEGRL